MKTHTHPADQFTNQASSASAPARLERLRALLVCLAVVAGGCDPLQGAVAEAWVQRHTQISTNSADQAWGVACDAAGNVIMAGTSDDFRTGPDILTVKYSGANGAVLWLRRYAGSGSSRDEVAGLAVAAGGDVVITGWTGASYASFESADFYTAKYGAADGALLWEVRYNGPANGEDRPAAVAVDGDGNVLITGHSWNGINTDYYTAKYSATNGALLWEQRFDGLGRGADQPTAIVVDRSNNVVVTGSSWNGIDSDYCTLKYASADGRLMWIRRHDGGAGGGDFARALTVDGSNNVVVTGESAGFESVADYLTAKYRAADGVVVWEQRYDGPAQAYDAAVAVAVDSQGDVLVTGESAGAQETADYCTVKYRAADGALRWEQRYSAVGGGQDVPRALAVSSDDDVVVTGASWGRTTAWDGYTAKYAAEDGALLWEQRYDNPAGPYVDFGTAVTMDSDDNVVVSGYSAYASSFADCFTAKYAAADGVVLWEALYNGTARGSGHAIAVAVSEGRTVAVTGSVQNGRSDDLYTAAYDGTSGVRIWERRYDGPEGFNDYPMALAMDREGNVLVTGAAGFTLNNEHSGDYYTVKYAAGTGERLWEQRYNGPWNSFDQAMAIAVDSTGAAVVTGYSFGTEGSRDIYTAKYRGSDGALLWEQRYNSPDNGEDTSVAVAIDSRDNVVIAGDTIGANGRSDGYTAKYAAADGALVWEQPYHGPADGNDLCHRVAVDGTGDVVVAGWSSDGVGFDFFTAKYAAADGRLLWEQRYNGPANRDDLADGVAVDPAGNVVVTGHSDSGSDPRYPRWDYATVMYAGADGRLLWERRFNGPADGGDAPQAMAIDREGNVVVTGTSETRPPVADIVTIKYAAVDGAVLWEQRYNGPGDGDEGVGQRGLAIGPGGLIVVAGSSEQDLITLAYQPPALQLTITLLGGSVRLSWVGEPGLAYQVQRCSALHGAWSTVATLAAPPAGAVHYDEPVGPGSAGFYRVLLR